MFSAIISTVMPTDVPTYTYWIDPQLRTVQIKIPEKPYWKPSTNSYNEVLARINARPDIWEVTTRSTERNDTYGAY